MTLYLLNFKNYYNRQAMKYDTLQDYLDNTSVLDIAYNYDFNPNDGIWSTVIVNSNYGNADYLLVTEDDEIVSRWYVLESTRKRLAQYELKMLRDVIADTYETVISAPTFIEKATVKYGSPLLFNSEDLTFNQIKTSELQIRDNSLCPWIVGYITSDTEAISIDAATNDKYYTEYAQLEDIPFYDAIQARTFKGNSTIKNLSVEYSYYLGSFSSKISKVSFNSTGNIGIQNSTIFGSPVRYEELYSAISLTNTQDEAAKKTGDELSAYYKNNITNFDAAITNDYGLSSSTNTAELLNTYSENGTIIKVGNIIYKVTRSSGTPVTKTVNPADGSDTYDQFVSMIENADTLSIKLNAHLDNTLFGVTYSYTQYSLSIEQLSGADLYHLDIPGSTQRRHLADSPYDMFAIPYNFNTKLSAGKTFSYDIDNCNAEAAMAVASKMSTKLGSKLIDIQLLPYCPIPELCATTPGVLLYKDDYFTNGVDYSYIYSSSIAKRDIPSCT